VTEAEKLFNQIFARWLNRQGFITSFRRTSHEGMEAAKEKIQKQVAQFTADMAEGHDYDDIFSDKEAFFKALSPEKMTHDMTIQTIDQAQIAVDAASIVFAHSVVDGAALDYCRVTALVAPGDWVSAIDQRSVKLSDVRSSSYDQLLRGKLEEYFEQLERESLLKKADLLFARCQPPDKWSAMDNYVFDRDRLKTLDDYRHEVIHGIGPIKSLASADEEVDYLMRMVLFFQGLTNLRYGLKLNPFYAFAGVEPPILPTAESPPNPTEAGK
jgi:hypothetical protein